MSKAARDRVWNWFADDWGARFAAHSAMLIVMTRWHVDDLLGRYLERFPDMRTVCYPAIAEEAGYIEGNLVRRKGAPLFRAVKPLTFLEERRRMMSQASWQSRAVGSIPSLLAAEFFLSTSSGSRHCSIARR